MVLALLQLGVNASITLAGIPPQDFDDRLANRSALDWVIDPAAF